MKKRGPKIQPKIRELIILRSLEEPRIPRDAVAMHLIDEIERMGMVAPSEETIVKMVSRTRNQLTSPLDNPWSIASSASYHFSPDIIPILIGVQKLQRQSEYEEAKEPLTIRQAQWIARLYPLITEIYVRKYSLALDESNKPVSREYLWTVYIISVIYAQTQRMNEVVGTEFQNSTVYDEDFFITERWWGLSQTEWAARYMASRSLYEVVLKDYKNERAR